MSSHPPVSGLPASSPFNPANILLDESALKVLLELYDVRHTVRDINVYRRALTHRSYCTRKNENFVQGNTDCPPDCLPLQEESYERHEFLGDAVLNLVVASYLFERYPDENEGFLTRLRTRLVNGNMLAELCAKTDLSRYVILSKQIEENEGRSNKKILEDSFESFLGALFCDAGENGYEVVRKWLTCFLERHVDFPALIAHHNNYKDTLIKYFQHVFNCAPRFCELPYQNQKFSVCVSNREGTAVGRGTGTTRKLAEVDAARCALLYYGQTV